MSNKLVHALLISLIVSQMLSGQNQIETYLGEWGIDMHDMPYFSYTGELPFMASLEDGTPAVISNDPYFLLGNYRFKLFAHISGEYEIYTTERVISHFNSKENAKASIRINSENYNLTGINSVAADPTKTSRAFGAGFAEYTYTLPDLKCKRILSVLPSNKINEGTSGFRLSVFFKNTSNKKVEISYSESLKALYDKVSNSTDHDKLEYNLAFEKTNNELVKGRTQIISDSDPFPEVKREDFSHDEYFPPVLFISAESGENVNLDVSENQFIGSYTATLNPDEQLTIDFIIGYSLSGSDNEIEEIRKSLMEFNYNPDFNASVSNSPFSNQWSKKTEHFKEESDTDLRRELIWHNYVLESLATYSDYFEETFIPQGCMYLFSRGVRAAPRDQNQHALAACYTNPELAKSIIRYVLKKSDQKGNIPFMDLGVGVVTSKYYQTSDQQLFFFMLISEYLRITKDYDFLLEEVSYYPGENAGSNTILSRIGEYYRYLNEEVGVGPHGLIRLGNSDWNDIVFYRLDTKYNSYYLANESHMNTTMAASILPKLTEELLLASKQPVFHDQTAYITNLTASINSFRDDVWNAFLIDNGNRSFARRMYFNREAVGDSNMFLEPQGFLMQVDEFGIENKEILYKEIQKRILDSEKIGARQEEKMELSEQFFGSRENGGIWYSLNGPLIIGLSTWNQDAAWELFHRLTLKNQTKNFPQYWSCYWSSFDSVDSSILPSEGLHAQKEMWKVEDIKMTYCSHIHAWLLYSYTYLKELQ